MLEPTGIITDAAVLSATVVPRILSKTRMSIVVKAAKQVMENVKPEQSPPLFRRLMQSPKREMPAEPSQMPGAPTTFAAAAATFAGPAPSFAERRIGVSPSGVLAIQLSESGSLKREDCSVILKSWISRSKALDM